MKIKFRLSLWSYKVICNPLLGIKYFENYRTPKLCTGISFLNSWLQILFHTYVMWDLREFFFRHWKFISQLTNGVLCLSTLKENQINNSLQAKGYKQSIWLIPFKKNFTALFHLKVGLVVVRGFYFWYTVTI